MSGPSIRGRVLRLPRGATLTRVSRINCAAREFICFPVSGLLDPFTPSRQHAITRDDVELLPLAISAVVWGESGEVIIHIEVADNNNALSWMSKRDELSEASRLNCYLLSRNGLLICY